MQLPPDLLQTSRQPVHFSVPSRGFFLANRYSYL